MNSKKHGLLLGKFLPPHRGHVYLADFARHYVDHLTIVVGTIPSEPIPGDLRYQWMRELFPSCNVVHLDKDLPQEPSEHPDFWDIWQRELLEIAPCPPDILFASETYGHKLSEVLGARFIPVDPDRSIMPISGTAVRENPYDHWDLIPPNVRTHYLKRICVFGPESTGKSTLTSDLAQHFKTRGVPEYARTYLEQLGNELQIEKLLDIARGQCASEDAIAPSANKLLITDTDALLTTVWSQFLYQQCDPQLEELAKSRDSDLYLLTDVDVPWVEDPVRYLPSDRSNFHALCETTLKENGKDFVKLSGSWEKRFKTAVEAIEALFKK
ncbi:AAA family ATPase [Verrucomicrobiaceae bacterium 227]